MATPVQRQFCPADMSGVVAVLLAGGRGTRLRELTDREAKPAVFFAGQHRIIDFTMANAVRSGIGRMIVATQYRPDTLNRHIPGRWGSAFARGALTLRDGRCVTGRDGGYAGTADAVFTNAAELDAADARDVVVLAGDHVYDMDYSAMVAAHRASGAMATVAASSVPVGAASAFGVIDADLSGRITGFLEKPKLAPGMPDDPFRALVSMGIYVFNWPWLRAVLEADARDASSDHDFGRDVIPQAVAGGVASVWRQESDGTDAYWRDVGTLDAYRLAQLDFQNGVPPCLLPGSGETARISALPTDMLQFGFALTTGGLSLCAPRHRPDAAARWSVLSESVIMPGARLGTGVRLSRAIVAPGTTVPAGLVVGEDPDEDTRWFRRTDEGTVLITTSMLARRGVLRTRSYPASAIMPRFDVAARF